MGVTNLTRWPWTIDAADYGGAITNPPVTILAPINNGPFGQQTQQNVAFGTFNWTAHDAAEGDQVILTDTNGKEVWRSAPATGADFGRGFGAGAAPVCIAATARAPRATQKPIDAERPKRARRNCMFSPLA